jgi:hypothetical protein
MDKREQRRQRLAADVMRLTRIRGFRDALIPLCDDGSAPFVVGLPDDTLGQIARRAETLGGRAHLVVFDELPDGVKRIRLLLIQPSIKRIDELDDQCECAVNDQTTLAMLMEHIEVGTEVTYHTYDSETVIRFLTDSVQAVPA